MSIFCVIIRNAVSSWSTCADWLWAIRPHLYLAMGSRHDAPARQVCPDCSAWPFFAPQMGLR